MEWRLKGRPHSAAERKAQAPPHLRNVDRHVHDELRRWRGEEHEREGGEVHREVEHPRNALEGQAQLLVVPAGSTAGQRPYEGQQRRGGERPRDVPQSREQSAVQCRRGPAGVCVWGPGGGEGSRCGPSRASLAGKEAPKGRAEQRVVDARAQ